MLVSPAYAQTAGASPGSGLEAILPLILIFVVFYFLLIRPQQKKMKQHKAALAAIRKGDTIVTGGGIMGKVTKVADDNPEVQVEIAPDVKVKVQRDLISAVIKTQTAAEKKAAKAAKAADSAAPAATGSGGLLGKLLGKK